jgi:hypothetical protein
MFAALIEAAGVPLTQCARNSIDSLGLPGQGAGCDDENPCRTSRVSLARKCLAGRGTPEDLFYRNK